MAERVNTWKDTFRLQADTKFKTGTGAIKLKVLYVGKFWTPFAPESDIGNAQEIASE